MPPKNSSTHSANLVLPSSNGALNPVRHCSASSVVVSDRQGLNALLKQVAQAQTSSKTLTNNKSSRSHSFTYLKLPGNNSITLVDLASYKRDSVGSSATELQAINTSLTALTQALSKLITSLNKTKAGKQAKKGKKKNLKPQQSKITSPKRKPKPPKPNTTPNKTAPMQGIKNI